MYIDLQIFITIWLGIKHTTKPNLVKPMYMYVDLYIYGHGCDDDSLKNNSPKKLNKLADLIKNVQ